MDKVKKYVVLCWNIHTHEGIMVKLGDTILDEKDVIGKHMRKVNIYNTAKKAQNKIDNDLMKGTGWEAKVIEIEFDKDRYDRYEGKFD